MAQIIPIFQGIINNGISMNTQRAKKINKKKLKNY